MKLSDLKTGMIVKTRSKRMYLVMRTEKGIFFVRKEGFNDESTYKEDLTSCFTEHDIITVFNTKQMQGFENIFNYINLTCLWERKAPIDYNTYAGKICKFWDNDADIEDYYIGVYKEYDSTCRYPHYSYERFYKHCKLLTQEELKKLGIMQ